MNYTNYVLYKVISSMCIHMLYIWSTRDTRTCSHSPRLTSDYYTCVRVRVCTRISRVVRVLATYRDQCVRSCVRECACVIYSTDVFIEMRAGCNDISFIHMCNRRTRDLRILQGDIFKFEERVRQIICRNCNGIMDWRCNSSNLDRV